MTVCLLDFDEVLFPNVITRVRGLALGVGHPFTRSRGIMVSPTRLLLLYLEPIHTSGMALAVGGVESAAAKAQRVATIWEDGAWAGLLQEIMRVRVVPPDGICISRP